MVVKVEVGSFPLGALSVWRRGRRRAHLWLSWQQDALLEHPGILALATIGGEAMSLFARCPDCHNGYKDGRPCLRCDYGYEELDRDAAIERMLPVVRAIILQGLLNGVALDSAAKTLLDAAGGERT